MVIDADVSVCCGVSADAAERSRLVEGRLAPAKEKHTQLCVSCVSCREAGPAAARDPGGGEGGAMGRSRVVVGVGVCSKNSCRRRIYYSGPFKFLDCLLGFAFPSTRSDGPQSGDEVGFRGRSWANHRPGTRQRRVLRPNKAPGPQSRSHFRKKGKASSQASSQSSHKCSQSLGEPALHCPFCPFCPRCPRRPRFPHCPPLLLAGATRATRATDEASCSLHCCSCFGLALTRRDRFKERTSAAWQCLHRLIALAESSEH